MEERDEEKMGRENEDRDGGNEERVNEKRDIEEGKKKRMKTVTEDVVSVWVGGKG